MKIAYVIEHIAGTGGMERLISQKANFLSERYGHDVSIITCCQNGQKPKFPLDPDITLIDFNINLQVNSLIKKRAKYKDWHRALTMHLLTNKYDIVISTGGADLRFLYKIKDDSIKIAEYHFSFLTNAYWADNLYRRRFGKIISWLIGQYKNWRTIRDASHYVRFIVLSATDCSYWSKYLNNCEYIYNFINTETVRSTNYVLESKDIITVGRHDTQKGYDYLLSAWEKVHIKHPDWHIYIYGGGDYFETKNIIDKKGLNESVYLMGFNDKIEYEYHKFSFFVLTSRAEGFGLVIAEAQAKGLPVVTFDTPIGPAEIVNDNIDGLVVPQVGDTETLAAKMSYLIENPHVRLNMSKKALSNSRRFNNETIMSKWNNLLSGLKDEYC